MANGSWKIARARGGARFPLFVVAVLAVVLLLVGKAQSSLFYQVRAGVADMMSPLLKSTAAPLAGVNRWLGSFWDIFSVYEDNLQLKEQNAKLMHWRGQAQILQTRLDRYRKLFNAVPDPELAMVSAKVIGRAHHPFMYTLILDAGRSNAVKPGQAVTDERGVIGRIFIVGEYTSWVIPLTDINSRIPVSVGAGEVQALLAGNNKRYPALESISPGGRIKDGDPVISSGDGGIVPAGLHIGIVVARGKEYRVALYADHSSVQDVVILDYMKPLEQPRRAGLQDLPVTAAGLPPAVPPEDEAAQDDKPPPAVKKDE